MIEILLALLVLQYSSAFLPTTKVECSINYFILPGMEHCHPHLTCADLGSISIVKRLGTGAVKNVFLGSWKGISVVLSVPVSGNTSVDFMSGIEVLKLLNPSKYIIQLIGYCEQNHVLLTEYHPNGNAADFFNQTPPESDSDIQSIHFCHQYSLILKYLHYGPAGRRVFCDSNSLEKLLSQLLVRTDLTLVLNDVDALPEVVNVTGVKCGHRQLYGTFVAPEQLWPSSEQFRDDVMTGYDEKTDIWKSAFVCEYFLNRAKGGQVLRYRLFNLHKKCKNQDPMLRPTSKELELAYNDVLKELNDHMEL